MYTFPRSEVSLLTSRTNSLIPIPYRVRTWSLSSFNARTCISCPSTPNTDSGYHDPSARSNRAAQNVSSSSTINATSFLTRNVTPTTPRCKVCQRRDPRLSSPHEMFVGEGSRVSTEHSAHNFHPRDVTTATTRVSSLSRRDPSLFQPARDHSTSPSAIRSEAVTHSLLHTLKHTAHARPSRVHQPSLSRLRFSPRVSTPRRRVPPRSA